MAIFDSYDPTKTARELQEAPPTTEKQVADPNGGILAKVTIYQKKTLKERVQTTINNIRRIDKDSVKVFTLSLRLNLMYIFQGLAGLCSLTMYQPTWTTRSSLMLSVAISDQRNKKQLEKEKDLEEDKKTVTEKPKDIDEWLRKFQEQ